MQNILSTMDYVALISFLVLWSSYTYLTTHKHPFFKRTSLNQAMSERRRSWIYNSLNRDLKMIDTQIMAGLQNGTAFFASTSILAIGGCFALLGSTEQVESVFRDIPFVDYAGRTAFEIKVIGLTCLFGYSFFKFGWSYRLFNYCTILFGAIPMTSETSLNKEAAIRAAENVIKMNIIAAKNFNDGLRTIFLSIGYLGWFISPYVFILSTIIIIIALTRRQFFSEARLAIMDDSALN